MGKIEVQGTELTFSVLPLKLFSKGDWARVEIGVKNTYINYRAIEEKLACDELEEWIFTMFRFLAGAYGEEYSLVLEKVGVAVDFYPYTDNGNKVSREERRKNDCVMAIRLLMRDERKKEFLGGVYSLILHRKEIEMFAKSLKEEFDEVFNKRIHGVGKYVFAGVSPLGYTGCNYWYFDPFKRVNAGEYAWVEMGRHKTRQIVFVDAVRRFSEENAPCHVYGARRILRKATDEEVEAFLEELRE